MLKRKKICFSNSKSRSVSFKEMKRLTAYNHQSQGPFPYFIFVGSIEAVEEES
jgi:hypothetical protein